MPHLIFCLPAYNEAPNLGALLSRIDTVTQAHGYPYRVIAYSDGSRDDTVAVLQQLATHLPVTVFAEATNHGFGHALQVLITKACNSDGVDNDVAVFLDADHSHDPETLPAMLGKIRQGADMVIASRFLPQSRIQGFPLYRKALSHAASLYFRIMLPLPQVRDYTSGFRMIRLGTLRRLYGRYGDAMVEEKSFACQVELLSKLAPFAAIAEVPMTYYYGRKLGGSKLQLWRTIVRTISVGLRQRR